MIVLSEATNHNQLSSAPSFFRSLAHINHYFSHDFLGGPRHLKLAWVINFQKGFTLFWVLGLIYYFNNPSTQALIYLALHGSYGFCWLLKDVCFPDKNWQAKVTYGGALMSVLLVLGPYWLFAYLLVSDALGPQHSGANEYWLSFAVILHTLGIAIMLAADAQKFYTLKYKKGLITEGMFKHIRHPNYLGEIMIYASYAIVVWHWVPWVILISIWSLVFMTNIQMKEASMSRYPEWESYKKRSRLLIPKIF